MLINWLFEKTNPTYRICQLLWCKYSHCDRCQATSGLTTSSQNSSHRLTGAASVQYISYLSTLNPLKKGDVNETLLYL